jgi:hypothetical protein
MVFAYAFQEKTEKEELVGIEYLEDILILGSRQ